MYNRRMDIKTGLITPQSTPVKRSSQLRCSHGTTSRCDVPTQRRLPRKPARPLPNFPDELEPKEKYRLNHPVDFIVHVIIQTLYQHLVLHLAVIAQEELRSPILCIWMATTRSTIFLMRLASVINLALRPGLCAANVLFCIEVLIGTAYNLSTHLKDIMRYFWSEVLQTCRGFFRNQAQTRLHAVDQNLCPSQSIDTTPSLRMESLSSASFSPCCRKSACPPSPLCLRKSRPNGPIVSRHSPRLTPLHADMAQSSTNKSSSCLGRRVEDLQCILADCNEAQLEAAIGFVYGLHARAQARAGWKI